MGLLWGHQLTCSENLQHLQWLIITQVLDEVAHVARNDAHIAGHVVESAGVALGRENGDSCSAADEERPTTTSVRVPGRPSGRDIPFICIWVPVHLSHRAGFNIKMRSRDGLGDWEVSLAVHNTSFPSTALFCGSLQHVVCVLVLGLLERLRGLLLDTSWH